MSEKIVTVGGSHIVGTCFDDAGNVHDFEGDLGRHYTNLKRATAAARRKYADSSISVLRIENHRERYRITESAIRQYGTRID